MNSEEDKKFLAYIRENEDIGFGRMMQIISYAWYRKLEREQGKIIAEGAFTETCISSLPSELKKEYFDELEEEEKQGMDY